LRRQSPNGASDSNPAAGLALRVAPVGQVAGFAAVAILTMALSIGATTASSAWSTPRSCARCPIPSGQLCASKMISWHRCTECRDVRAGVEDFERSGHISIRLARRHRRSTSPAHRSRSVLVAPWLGQVTCAARVKPELGRWFDPLDQTPGFTMEVVINHELWQQPLEAIHTLGRSLRLDNDVYRVNAVMPPGFRHPAERLSKGAQQTWGATGWAAPPTPPPVRESRFLPEPIARLNPGLTVARRERWMRWLHRCNSNIPADYPPRALGMCSSSRSRRAWSETFASR